MKDYTSYSFWLETAGDDLTPRPPLEDSLDVDVAILGAGFSGLWTAYYLLDRQPGLRVAVLEREIAGWGASGRNGGWCSSTFPVTLRGLAGRWGREAARDVQVAMWGSVDEVGRVCTDRGIDAHFVQGGALRLARGAHQLPTIRTMYADYRSLGLAERYCLLGERQTAERVRVRGALGALWVEKCAVLHPGRLVRGLARVVEGMGAAIYEGTEVTAFSGRGGPMLSTACGTVRATSIVLAGEAYLTRLRPLHRQLIPLYSLIVLTEPLSAAQWAEIGWDGRECIASCRLTVDYLSRTADGRILFGSRGAPYRWGSRVEDRYDQHATTHASIREMLFDWFPQLRGIRLTHTWGGPVGMPRDWMPSVVYDRHTGIGWARGYTGQGVATSNLAGRILADLITETPSEVTTLPLVGHRSPDWEPEPLRWAGLRYLQEALLRVDRRAERTGRAPSGRSLAERLSSH